MNNKTIKYIILFLVFVLCSSGTEYYENSIPGLPIGPGTRIGGVWKKTEPKCSHDMSALDKMKEESMKSAANWRKVAFGTSILSFVAVCIWYSFHVPQAGGVAICSILYSAFSTLMAVAMTVMWIIVLFSIVVIVIAVGLLLHKKDIRNVRRTNTE